MSSSDSLAQIFARQLDLQRESFGGDPASLAPEAKIQFIKDMVVALEDELHEALAEVGWKPWATSRHINEGPFKKELIDALHFWVNLCLAAGMDHSEVVHRYFAKAEVNAQRQADGYDGVSTKCPSCGRAQDEPED